MADKPAKAPTVEVRLLSKQFRHYETDGVEIVRHQGDVFQIDRAVYEADIEPDRGLDRPAHSRTFFLISEEKVAEQKKAHAEKSMQDRIASVRESMRDQMQTLESARIMAKVQEAENTRMLAETLKPLDRPGAKRVA